MIFKIIRSIQKDFGTSLLAATYRKSNSKETITKDANRWVYPYRLDSRLPKNYTIYDLLFFLFKRYKEFRNLYYYRLKKDKLQNHFLMRLLVFLYPPRDSISIKSSEIGPGLFLQHGTAAHVGAVKIGENCWLNQSITIGFAGRGKAPTLGNNVVVRPGAKIFGQVTIGDNSIVGANSVVLKDVPPNCTVVGVPARIIRRNGERVDEKL